MYGPVVWAATFASYDTTPYLKVSRFFKACKSFQQRMHGSDLGSPFRTLVFSGETERTNYTARAPWHSRDRIRHVCSDKPSLFALQKFHSRLNLGAMALVLGVALISGKGLSLEADLDASAESLKKRARGALGVGMGRLFNASGWRCDAGDSRVANWRLSNLADRPGSTI